MPNRAIIKRGISMKLSAVIITYNEGDRVEECLKSVSFCDEIIVVDSGSSDNTLEIARKYTDKVFFHEWEGYARQKEFAAKAAQNLWVLLVDADERVSPQLREEILSLSGNDGVNGYFIKRDLYFMGRKLKYGGAGRDWVLRLFKSSDFVIRDTDVHEAIEVKGNTARLKGALEHFSYRDLTDYFNCFNRYTSLGAVARYKKGMKAPFIQNFRVFYEFVMRYFIRGGFLDGYPGFVYAMISSFYAWIKYAKLKELTDGLAGTEQIGKEGVKKFFTF